ncbi:autotransporter domain-containing protein [Candidatus Igneacidithiobacillus taiwanensis]|uniref:autotransporter outer membrane beta-barrel domain-containing protein n=1 Tax=Candidatus Igneacidithiobacillus taiwanensis TaxID=1945924 RepID=UPI00289CD71F|nr:autotransporter domain-containing protein [Candidatus Igneacidithiobacillus taiwanensis]
MKQSSTAAVHQNKFSSNALRKGVCDTLLCKSALLIPLLLSPAIAMATPQIITGGGTVTNVSGNQSTSGITVEQSTLDIASGSGLGSGPLNLQNGALRTSGSSTINNSIVLDPGAAPATINPPCGESYCYGVGDSMNLNTTGNTYVSTPSLLNQLNFPSNNKSIGIWLPQDWTTDYMTGMQSAMNQGYAPVLFDYYLGDLGSMGSNAWSYVQQNANAWLANTQQLANYLSTLHGTVTVVLQPEFNVQGVGNQPQFGKWLAEAAQILKKAQHPGLTILVSAGVGDFGDYEGRTEDASDWSYFYPSLIVAAPYLDFITFQEMRGATPGGQVETAQQEGMSTIAGRVIAFSRYLQATYNKPLLLGYIMMDPYSPPGDSENWSAIAAKAYTEILQISPELAQQGVFGSMAMELFNNNDHATETGQEDYFGISSDYYGLVNSNGPAGSAAIGNGPYTLNANGEAWVNGTANAGTVQDIHNGGTFDTDGNADTFTGTISGNGGLFVVGGGSATLTANNTYTGNTYIEDSTLLQLGNGGTSGSILGNVLDDGVLSFNRSDDIVFPGEISGLGMVWQQGPGTLQLTGNNSYSGGTVITGGTLGIANGSAIGTGDLVMDGGTLETTAAQNDSFLTILDSDGGTINTDGNDDVFSNNVINNGGSLAVVGGGSLILNGPTNSATETMIGGLQDTKRTLLEVGDLDHPTATLQSPVLVTPAGTLRGHGTIDGNVVNDGVVFPGGSMGILTINGNYSQAPNGTLVIEVNPNSKTPVPSINNDELSITGSASLAGDLGVQEDNGTTPNQYYVGQQYTILTASNGVTGKFSSIVNANSPYSPFIMPTPVYGSNQVSMVIMPTPAPAPSPAPASNQSQDPNDLAYRSGRAVIDSPYIINSTLFSTLGTLLDGAQQIYPGEFTHSRLGPWAKGFGGFGNAFGASVENYGGVAGYGFAVSGSLTLGAAFAGSDTSTTTSTSITWQNDNTQSFGGFLYAVDTQGNLRISGTMGGGSLQENSTRNLYTLHQSAAGSTDGWYFGTGLQVQYLIPMGDTFLMPYGQASYLHTSLGGYTEKGTGILNLHYGFLNTNLGSLSGGFRIGKDIRGSVVTIVPWVSLGATGYAGARHATQTYTLGVLNATETAIAAPAATGDVGAGITFQGTHTPWTVKVGYNGQYAPSATISTFDLLASYRW